MRRAKRQRASAAMMSHAVAPGWAAVGIVVVVVGGAGSSSVRPWSSAAPSSSSTGVVVVVVGRRGPRCRGRGRRRRAVVVGRRRGRRRGQVVDVVDDARRQRSSVCVVVARRPDEQGDEPRRRRRRRRSAAPPACGWRYHGSCPLEQRLVAATATTGRPNGAAVGRTGIVGTAGRGGIARSSGCHPQSAASRGVTVVALGDRRQIGPCGVASARSAAAGSPRSGRSR